MATPEEDSAEAAINRVLAAERRARDNIARCEVEAAAQVTAARSRAKRVAERTDARMSRLRTRVERRTADDVTALRAQAADIRRQPVAPETDPQRLEEAAARLATRLTGGPS